MTSGALPINPLTGSKRAALRLALLPPRDRRWILRQLPGEKRLALEDLLAPLLVLGPKLLASVRGEIEPLLALPDLGAVKPIAHPAPQAEAALRTPTELEQASADELTAVLRELPLACSSVLGQRMPANRRHVLDAIRHRAGGSAAGLQPTEPAVSSAFVEALADVVEQRLAQRRTAGLAGQRG